MFGIDRQVYYRRIKKKKQKQHTASEVLSLVTTLRNAMPRLGTRKLYYILQPQLEVLSVGRDRLFDILRANRLLIAPSRSYRITTNSHHRFRKHKNLLKNVRIERPEQVWVSDITYLGNRANPCYLSLITDAYSKMIVGHCVSDNLNTNNCVKALMMAVKTRKYKTDLIHHSDRGLQYCSDAYQRSLPRNGIKCSMTESYDPYQNAVAERANGILKQEFMIDDQFEPLAIMKKIVKESIDTYNNKRPHYSCLMNTPKQMHAQSEIKMRTYVSQKNK